jgi:hypothetical protein
MKYFALLIATAAAIIGSFTALSPSVSAVDVLPGCGGNSAVATSATCQGRNNVNNDPISGNNGILIKATRIIATVTGIVAVIMLIIGGFRYVSSGGDASKVASAKNTIIYAIVGVAIAISAGAIVTFVLGKL